MLNLSEQMKKETHVTSNFEFTFSQGAHKDESYEAIILVPLLRMTEACTTLRLEISSVEKPHLFYTIGLDTENGCAAILDKSSPIERNFAKSFIDELDNHDWVFLKLYNRVLTNKKSEEFTEFETLKVDFTDLVDSIEKNGEFIKYHQIFPNANRPKIYYKDAIYYIEDEYFISHFDQILQVGLCCMVMEADSWFDWENPKTRFANFDYTTQLFSLYEEGVFYDQAFFAEVKKQLPDLSAMLKQRYANLHLVYENYCKRAHLHFPVPISSVQNGKSLNSLLPPKVGRNDPCPCGSGKKYKKCCML